MEQWERNIAFTVAEAPFDTVRPAAEGVIRARQGPSGVIEGERRPPAMVLEAMQRAAAPGSEGTVFEGVLILSPAEAPHLTVIEHPLDNVGPAGFPEDLARVLDKTRLVTFDSDMEKASLQHHGLSVRVGDRRLRSVALSRGYETTGWHWDEDGDPQPFEDAARLARKRIWQRLDRALLYDYAAKLGLDPARSLFGRKFAASALYYPLPFDDPAAEADRVDLDGGAAFAAGVKPTIGLDVTDADFAGHAGLMGAMMRWERALDQARVKAWRSSENAKTPKGRERAQWRVVEVVREVIEDAQRCGLETRQIGPYFSHLHEPMRELGRETDAYRVFRELCPRPFWMFWRR